MDHTTVKTRPYTTTPAVQAAAARAREARQRKILERRIAAAEDLLRENGYSVQPPS